MMTYSVVIPTHREPQALLMLLQSLQQQTFLPEKIRIIYDIDDTKKLEILNKNISVLLSADIQKKIQIIHPDTDSLFYAGRGVSYVRNYGISKVTSLYTLCIDDDNTVSPTFAQSMHESIVLLEQQNKKDILLIPTEYHRGVIRSQGYRAFNFWLGRPTPVVSGFSDVEKYILINFACSNCLYARTDLYRQYPFDERMQFVYEDFDCTYRMTRGGVYAYVACHVPVYHHMRNKTPLEQTYIATPLAAYKKARNRIWFVYHVGTRIQRLIYFGIGLWIHTLFLFIKVLIYAGYRQRLGLVRALVCGTWDGIFLKK